MSDTICTLTQLYVKYIPVVVIGGNVVLGGVVGSVGSSVVVGGNSICNNIPVTRLTSLAACKTPFYQKCDLSPFSTDPFIIIVC